MKKVKKINLRKRVISNLQTSKIKGGTQNTREETNYTCNMSDGTTVDNCFPPI